MFFTFQVGDFQTFLTGRRVKHPHAIQQKILPISFRNEHPFFVIRFPVTVGFAVYQRAFARFNAVGVIEDVVAVGGKVFLGEGGKEKGERRKEKAKSNKRANLIKHNRFSNELTKIYFFQSARRTPIS